MKNKILSQMSLIMALVFALTSVMAYVPTDAEAKSRSSFSSSSRSYSSKSYSSSSSKSYSSSSWSSKKSSSSSSSKTASSVFGQRKGSSYSSSSKSTAQKKSTDKAVKNAFGSKSGQQKATTTTASSKTFTSKAKSDNKVNTAKKQQQNKKSLDAYKASKTKFKKPAPKVNTAKYSKNPVYSKATTRRVTRTTYYAERDTYYSSWNRPSYVYYGSPSYGMYDAMFMWMMLDSINDARYRDMYYHHRGSSDFQQWRAEADRLAKDNAELKAKLNKLDGEMTTMQTKGVAPNPNYTPEGVPAEMMVSPDVLFGGTPVLRIATGSEALNYHYFGQLMRSELGQDVEVVLVPTSGSVENLKLLREGKVDAIMVQSNVKKLWEKENPNSNLVAEEFAVYPEPIQMVAKRSAGVSEISDLGSKHIVIPGPRGSGTDKTWMDLVSMDSDYADVKKMNMSYDQAMLRMNDNENVVMTVVTGLGSSFMRKVDQLAGPSQMDLTLVPVNDFGFFDLDDVVDKNGNPVYSVVEIPANTYPNLQKGQYWGSNSIETMAVDALFLLSSNWAQRAESSKVDNVAAALLDAQPKMLKRVGVLN